MTDINNNKKKFRNDLILILAVVLIAAIALVCFLLTRQTGEMVTVYLDGRQIASYSLSEDRTEVIRSGEAGDRVNVLVIRDGQAWISEADCPDLICAKHRPISHEGDSIICLPNKLVVAIE